MEKRKNPIKFAALLLGAAVVLSACSAIKDNGSAGSTAKSETSAAGSAAATAEAYKYPELDMKGESIRFLNSKAIWDMYVYLDKESQTGEVLDDAVYKRNRAVEERFNCKIKEITLETPNTLDPLVTQTANTILAGDDQYDIIYLPINRRPAMIAENYFLKLNEIPELNLSQPWWDQQVIDNFTIGGDLYFATSNLHLMPFDSSWCLFFNEKMMEDRKLDKPYKLVSDGKWTIDALYNYCKAAASLNGDESFGWKQDGKCLYGVATHTAAIDKFIFGTGERFVSKDAEGYPVFTADSVRFGSVAEKLAAFAKDAGAYFKASPEDFNAAAGGYIYTFSVGRSMFLTAELKVAQVLRDMDDTFGIVPFPKYDESQEKYYTALCETLLVFTIPKTNTKVSQTAIVADALSYDSYRDILPIYYDVKVSQKGLRNEDSIKMLDVMRSSRGVDMAYFFGWTSAIGPAVRYKILSGDGAVASTVASNKSAITASIDKTVAQFKDMK